MIQRSVLRVRALLGASLVALLAGQALASFPIGQTVGAGGRDQVFRMTDPAGGSGTANLFGVSINGPNVGAATEVKLCFVTANHVASGGVANIDYRGLGHAGTFNAIPVTQTVQQLGGEDIAFVGLKFSKAQIGAANFATLAGLTGLTLAADPGGNHTFQEWGYGISAVPDAALFPGYQFAYHSNVAGEQYGTLRTFTNQLTGNVARNTTGYNVRDLKWIVGGPLVLAQLGSGAPGDSGAGLQDLTGPANTIQGILTGGQDDRFTDKLGNNYIAWKNAFEGYGLGFTAQIVADLNDKCAVYVPGPGMLGLGLAGATVLAARRRRS